MNKTFKNTTYKELEQKVIDNRIELRKTTDLNRKRTLINENHDMMVEMDARWNRK